MMKLSRANTAAITALLVLSITGVGLFLQQINADGYKLVISHYDVYYCTN